MSVKEIMEILLDKDGYLRFKLKGTFYAIEDLNGQHVDNTVIFTLRETNGYTDINKFYYYLKFKESDFKDSEVLFAIVSSSRLYSFSNDIEQADDYYTVKLD